MATAAKLGSEKLGWIGTGRMGFPMAQRLAKAGGNVAAYNRTKSKAEVLVKLGAKAAQDIAGASQFDFVVTMLADDRAAEETALGEGGIVLSLPKGGTHISCSTISIGRMLQWGRD